MWICQEILEITGTTRKLRSAYIYISEDQKIIRVQIALYFYKTFTHLKEKYGKNNEKTSLSPTT